MVPITIAYFSSESGTSRSSRGVRAALLFALGIIATFTALGLALAAVFGAASLNQFAAHPVTNLLLAVLFLVFAANLFGWLEFSLPTGLIKRANQASSRSDSVGSLLMGGTFTLTSVTCTAPFVGTLLVLASRGSLAAPVVGMLVYSAAFALPFFLLALAPRYVARLPRAGEWIRTMRILIGLLEVGAAVKFLANADVVQGLGFLTREVVLAAWAALAFIGAAYLARDVIPQARASWRSLPLKLAPVGVALFIASWLLSGTGGKALRQVEAFLPPSAHASPSTPATSEATTSAQWILNDYPAALAAGRATGKLVFLDFTGYTCTNCRWMEANVFTEPAVAAELQRFVLTRLYTDGEGELYEQQQAFQERTFGTVALPLYAVVNANGKVLETLSGVTRKPADFIAFLKRARAPTVASR
jgi:thiol:disulfide interchange protein DsbD